MTNAKAFWICFLAPILFFHVSFFGVKMMSLAFNVTNSEALFIAGILIAAISVLVSLTSVLVSPLLIMKKYGKEFSRYGFYGSLASLPVMILSANLLYRSLGN